MPAVTNFKTPDFDHPDENEHRRQLAETARSLRNGKLNSAFDFDLAVAPATSTTVQDPRIAATSRIVLTGGNTHGIAEVASQTVQVLQENIVPGQFVVTHLPSTLTRSIRAQVLS